MNFSRRLSTDCGIYYANRSKSLIFSPIAGRQSENYYIPAKKSSALRDQFALKSNIQFCSHSNLPDPSAFSAAAFFWAGVQLRRMIDLFPQLSNHLSFPLDL
jgi:hypothetical protein